MAYTDDIPEKIADVLLDQGPRAMNFVLGMGAATIQGAGVLSSKALEALLKRMQEDKELRELLHVEGEISPLQMNEMIRRLGLRSSTVRVADSDAKEFESLMQQQGVLYAKLNMAKDNGHLFVFLDKDNEKVENLTTVMLARRGAVNEMRPDLYFQNMVPDTVHTIGGLDNVEMSLFRQYARSENLLYTVLPKEGDTKNLVVYDPKDEMKARRAMLHLSWDLTGANGARYRKQVEYHLEGHNKIHLAIEDAEREMFIVSQKKPGNFVQITAEDYSLYKNGKKVSTVSRANPAFATRCLADCDGLDSAVVLDADEYRPDLAAAELLKHPTMDLHVADYDESIEQNKINSLLNLVAQKGGLDNEHNTTWGLNDPSVSYSEYSGLEFIMDTDERNAREREFNHFRDAVFSSEKRHSREEIHMDEKSLDFIIAKAQERQRVAAGLGQEHAKGKAPEPFL